MTHNLQVQYLLVQTGIDLEVGELDHWDLVVSVQIDDGEVLVAVEGQVLAVLIEAQLVYFGELLLVGEGDEGLVVVPYLLHHLKYRIGTLQVVYIQLRYLLLENYQVLAIGRKLDEIVFGVGKEDFLADFGDVALHFDELNAA